MTEEPGPRIQINPEDPKPEQWLKATELEGRQLHVQLMLRSWCLGEVTMAVRDWCALLDWFSQEYWKDVAADAVEQSQKETPTTGGANDELP